MKIEPEVIRRLRWNRCYRRWRAGILRNEPLCRSCAEAGFTVAAEHIDHIEAVHLAPERFWDRETTSGRSAGTATSAASRTVILVSTDQARDAVASAHLPSRGSA